MNKLGRELRETIRNLEKIRDSQHPPSDEIIEKIDLLYEVQSDLVDAAVNRNTQEYKQATGAMKEAAEKAKESIDDLAKLEKSIEKVAKAIEIAADLAAKAT